MAAIAAVGLGAVAVPTGANVSADGTSVMDVSPSGVAAPATDLDGWRQVFRDNFSDDVALGSFPDARRDRWDAYPSPWRDTSRKGLYSPERVVSIDDGVLTKHIRTENGQPLVAALSPKVTAKSPYGSLYGRYEVRMRSDELPGYKIAWMLWPDTGTNITGSASGVGGNGEIDFPETELDADHVKGFVHYQDATRRDDQSFMREYLDLTEWHTYTIEWTPDHVVFLIDGREVGRTTERIPNSPMHWVLQTETSIKHETPARVDGRVQIDWAAAWAYDPATSVAVTPTTTVPAPTTTVPAPTTTAPAPVVAVVQPTPSNPAPVMAWPREGSTVRGTSVQLRARAYATQVKWYIDGKEVGSDKGNGEWMVRWDSTTVANGEHKVFAKSRDSQKRWKTSVAATFTVDN